MNKKTRIIVIAATVLFIVGLIFLPKIKKQFSGNSKQVVPSKQAQGRGQQQLSVTGTVLEPQTLQTDLYFAKGLLLPDEEVNLSFETSGKITEIHFKEGTFVNKGTLLAKVNDAPLQAELKKLEAQLPLAEDRLYRQKTLLEKDAISQETYQTVMTELEKLKADLELIKSRIDQTELRAPFSGVIGLRQVSPGTYASPTTVVSKLTKISPLKLEFSMNENQVSQIRPGTKVSFTVTNDLTVYDADVYAVESNLDPKTLTLKARARYANTDGKLKPGLAATLETLLSETENALVIPSISSIAEMGRDIVYIYKDGVAHEVEITKGQRTSSSVEVVSGLQPGDTVLITGVMQLRDGLPVNISEFVPNTTE